MILIGTVKSGLGDLSFRMESVPGLLEAYARKTGLRIVPGSLNVELDHEWSMPPQAIRLEKEECGGQVSASLIPCAIRDTKAFIVRTDRNESGQGAHSKRIVEIIADIALREAYGLREGDRVEISVE